MKRIYVAKQLQGDASRSRVCYLCRSFAAVRREHSVLNGKRRAGCACVPAAKSVRYCCHGSESQRSARNAGPVRHVHAGRVHRTRAGVQRRNHDRAVGAFPRRDALSHMHGAWSLQRRRKVSVNLPRAVGHNSRELGRDARHAKLDVGGARARRRSAASGVSTTRASARAARTCARARARAAAPAAARAAAASGLACGRSAACRN